MHNPELVDKIARYLAKEVDLDDENFGWDGHHWNPERQEADRNHYREHAHKILDIEEQHRKEAWARISSEVFFNFPFRVLDTLGSSAGTGDVPPAPPASPPEG